MTQRIRTAMVLAAGRGTRMRHLSKTRPKPLTVLAGRTLLDRVLDHLEADGVDRIVVNTHYMGEMITEHLSRRSGIILSPEVDLLETGGGVRHALPHLGDDPFYVINSDAVWGNGPTPALRRLAAAWRDETMDALLLLQRMVAVAGTSGRGDFFLDPLGRVRRRDSREIAAFLFAGVQILHPRLFAGSPEGAFSLNRLYDAAAATNRLHGIVHDGEWYHVGTPEQLLQAEFDLALGDALVNSR
ncbi:MAG: nucleotidyltransferase family protein [Alphaproteobacteria bacterium]